MAAATVIALLLGLVCATHGTKSTLNTGGSPPTANQPPASAPAQQTGDLGRIMYVNVADVYSQTPDWQHKVSQAVSRSATSLVAFFDSTHHLINEDACTYMNRMVGLSASQADPDAQVDHPFVNQMRSFGLQPLVCGKVAGVGGNMDSLAVFGVSNYACSLQQGYVRCHDSRNHWDYLFYPGLGAEAAENVLARISDGRSAADYRAQVVIMQHNASATRQNWSKLAFVTMEYDSAPVLLFNKPKLCGHGKGFRKFVNVNEFKPSQVDPNGTNLNDFRALMVDVKYQGQFRDCDDLPSFEERNSRYRSSLKITVITTCVLIVIGFFYFVFNWEFYTLAARKRRNSFTNQQ